MVNNSTNVSNFINSNIELMNIQKCIDIIFNGTLIDGHQYFYSNKSPKISVIITVYNGEAYLKTSLLSIQNQDFKDLEIIMIDDGSRDNSVKLIFQNDRNRGMLYTKTKGALMASGKYILLLDEDDIYAQRNTFSFLYNEAEKNNLDLIKFRAIISNPKLDNIEYSFYNKEFPITYKPNVREVMFNYTADGKITMNSGTLTNYFIKRNILVEAIKEIDEKYLNEKMNYHDDYLIFFTLSRKANNHKVINKIFYIILKGWNTNNTKIQFRIKEKVKNKEYMRCNSLLNFIEFLFYKTENTFKDKKFAFYSFNRWFLS